MLNDMEHARQDEHSSGETNTGSVRAVEPSAPGSAPPSEALSHAAPPLPAATAPARDDNPRQLVAAALRRERTRAGLTLGELARRTKVGKSTLSQLESGDGNPSVETLWALSTALELPFSALLESPQAPVRVIRFGDGIAIPAGEANYLATLLSPAAAGTRRDIYQLRAEPNAPRVSAPHPRGTVEHLILSSGRALAGPVGAEVELTPGDYLSYAGDVEHIFDAREPNTVAILVSESS